MSPDRGRQLWLVPVLLVTVIATAIGGLLARQVYEDPGPGEPDAVLPTESSVPLAEQPGSRVVQGTTDAVDHPLYETLRSVLQTYFDAINDRDYERWTRAATEERVADEPEEAWHRGYRSTQDGNIVIYRIELVAEDAARVLITFTSVQDPSDAPGELQAPCIHWNVVFPMVQVDSDWKVDRGHTTVSPQHEACA